MPIDISCCHCLLASLVVIAYFVFGHLQPLQDGTFDATEPGIPEEMQTLLLQIQVSLAKNLKGLKLVISKCGGQDRNREMIDRAKKANMETMQLHHRINFSLECKVDERCQPFTKKTAQELIDFAKGVQIEGPTSSRC